MRDQMHAVGMFGDGRVGGAGEGESEMVEDRQRRAVERSGRGWRKGEGAGSGRRVGGGWDEDRGGVGEGGGLVVVGG